MQPLPNTMYLHTYTNLLLLQVDLDKLIVFKTKHAEHHGRLGKTIRGNGKPSECTVCPFGNGGTGFWCFLDGTLESMLKDLRPWYFWHKIPGNFDENNSSKQQKFREFLHFLHTKFREFLRKKATSRCFFPRNSGNFCCAKWQKFREF